MYLGRLFDLSQPERINRNRKRRVARLNQQELHLNVSNAVSKDFYECLEANRMDRFSVRPTHTYEDLALLDDLIGDRMLYFSVTHENHICAVALVIVDSDFATIQYLAGSKCSFDSGAQDMIVMKVKEYLPMSCTQVLFGTSTEPSKNHRELNEGLDSYKASWGTINYTAKRLTLIL
jgi:hypothetical protein